MNRSDIEVIWRCDDAPFFGKLIAKGKLAAGEQHTFEPHKNDGGPYCVSFSDAADKGIRAGELGASEFAVLAGKNGQYEGYFGSRYPAETDGYQADSGDPPKA